MRESIDNGVLIRATEEHEKRARKNGKPLDVRVHENDEILYELEEEWEELAERCNATIYMSPAWVQNWWKYFGRHRKRSLYFIAVRDKENLIAIAPMYKGYSILGPNVREERLQIIGSGGSPNEQMGFLDDYGISDFLDFLVDPSYEDEIAELLIHRLLSEEDIADRITFHQARDDSFIMRKIYPALRRTGTPVQVEHTDTCPWIDLSEVSTLSSYIKQVKSNARRRFRQTLRATGPDKEFRIESVESMEEVEEATENVIRLHQERWNKLGFPGVFHDPRFTGFFKDLVKKSFRNNQLWFKQAVDKGGVCAGRMILAYNGRYYDYISGFDDECPSAKYRPGISLLLKLVEEAVESGIQRVDLLRGEEGYKYDFTKKTFKNWKVTIQLSRKKTLWNRMTAPLLRIQAVLYRIMSRELKLLQVQQKKNGWWRMLGGYVSFRWTSLKLKMKS